MLFSRVLSLFPFVAASLVVALPRPAAPPVALTPSSGPSTLTTLSTTTADAADTDQQNEEDLAHAGVDRSVRRSATAMSTMSHRRLLIIGFIVVTICLLFCIAVAVCLCLQKDDFVAPSLVQPSTLPVGLKSVELETLAFTVKTKTQKRMKLLQPSRLKSSSGRLKSQCTKKRSLTSIH